MIAGKKTATADNGKRAEETWTLSVQYPTSTPLGVMPTGEFPNLELPASLDQYQYGIILVCAQLFIVFYC